MQTGSEKASSSLPTSSPDGPLNLMTLDNSPASMSCAPYETVLNMPPQSFFTGQNDFPMLSDYTDEAILGQLCFALDETGSNFYNSPLATSGSLNMSESTFLDNWDLTADSWTASTPALGESHVKNAAADGTNTLVGEHVTTSTQTTSLDFKPAKPGVCAAAVLIERTQQEQANLHLAALEDRHENRQACHMGAILVACEKLSDQMAAIDDCGECATRISTTLTECHAAAFIADALFDGVSQCVQTLAANKDAKQSSPPTIEVEDTPQQKESQMIRLGNYRVHLSASQELLQALVRRRLRLLQTKLNMLTDMRSGWSRPGSPGEEIRDCVLSELKARLSSQIMEVQL